MLQNYAFSAKPPRKSQEIFKLSANYHEINRKLQTAIPRRSHPAKYGEDL